MATVTFNTSEYERVHEKAPHYNKRGDWTFYVPSQLGKRPYLFPDVTYSEAKKQIEDKVANIDAALEFILAP